MERSAVDGVYLRTHTHKKNTEKHRKTDRWGNVNMGDCKHFSGLNIELYWGFLSVYYALNQVWGITIRLHEQTRNLGSILCSKSIMNIPSMLWGTAIINFSFWNRFVRSTLVFGLFKATDNSLMPPQREIGLRSMMFSGFIFVISVDIYLMNRLKRKTSNLLSMYVAI